MDGRYLLRAYLGGGAFGTVYRAWDVQESCRVVIKIVLHHAGDTRQRIASSYRILRRLVHPGLLEARAHAVNADEDFSYLVFAPVEGIPLSSPGLRRNVPECVAAALAADLCDTLAYLHRQNIVHRDVKPSNLLVVERGTSDALLLIDFDLAEDMESRRSWWAPTGRQLPDTRGLCGTPHYMSPERLQGAKASPVDDVYAAGLVLYRLLTGDLPPVQADCQSIECLREARTIHPPRLSGPNGNVSTELEAVLMTALDPDPAARFASAEELHRELQPLSCGWSRDALFDGDPRSQRVDPECRTVISQRTATRA